MDVAQAQRQSARSMLQHRAEQLEKKLKSLEVLEDVISWDNLDNEEEELLYELFLLLER